MLERRRDRATGLVADIGTGAALLGCAMLALATAPR